MNLNDIKTRLRVFVAALGFLGAFLLPIPVLAQTPLSIYSDGLGAGWQDWSWVPVANRNFANTAPVHSGSKSIKVTSAYWEGISFYHADFSTTDYTDLTFWAHGGTSGGQQFQVYAEHSGGAEANYILPGSFKANTWQKFTIPLSTLGIANRTDVRRINLQLRNSGTSGTFYLDDIELTPKPLPSSVLVRVQPDSLLQTVRDHHFGVNLTMWDDNFETGTSANTVALLKEMGTRFTRVPGGSLSDEFHWASNTTRSNTWTWASSFPEFIRAITNAGTETIVTVNYGSGSPQEAAAWVAYCNADSTLFGTTKDIQLGTDSNGRNWQTAGYWSRLRSRSAAQNPDNAFDFLAIGRTAPLNIRNWEIGNECYGTWEYDLQTKAHHAHTYATRATNYMGLMRAVDPTIRIGVVSVPGEDEYQNGYSDRPAINARTGKTHYGWTPVMLYSLKQMGMRPDFLIHHHYPQWTDPNNVANSPVNDSRLLQSTGNWAIQSATLRQHISDYWGSGGDSIELWVTENNADAGQQGRQSTSLVNGLYYADSLAQLLKTEFRSFVWWDLRNGTDTLGFFGSGLYGWRSFGDLGMINGPNTRLPAFYAAKLMRIFAQPGDAVIATSSSYDGLTAYSVSKPNGSVATLLINKLRDNTLTAEVSVLAFKSQSGVTAISYGIPNDEAARTNAAITLRDLTTNAIPIANVPFTVSIAPYSMTVLQFSPSAPELTITVPSDAAGQIELQLTGPRNARYVIESSPDLTAWSPVTTNILTEPSWKLTQPKLGTSRFFRATTLP